MQTGADIAPLDMVDQQDQLVGSPFTFEFNIYDSHNEFTCKGLPTRSPFCTGIHIYEEWVRVEFKRNAFFKQKEPLLPWSPNI